MGKWDAVQIVATTLMTRILVIAFEKHVLFIIVRFLTLNISFYFAIGLLRKLIGLEEM